MKKLLLSVFIFSALFPFAATADARYYAWSYQFAAIKPGEVEMEIYTRLTQPDIKDGSTAKWKRQFEIETGITDRLDISAYLVDVTAGGTTSFDEIKIRTRFKLTDNPGDFIVDPLLYAEYIFKADRNDFDAVEVKVVLAKDIGSLNMSINIIAEVSNKNWLDGSNWETGYSAGISYALLDGMLRLGAEAKGEWQSGKHMMGPSIAVEAGRLFAVISPLFGIGAKADDVSVQAIVGVMF